MELITLASIPAIIALVTLAKDLGLPSKLSPLLAVVLGILAAVADAYVNGGILDGPSFAQVVMTGILLGLGAAGLYDGAKAVGARKPVVMVQDAEGVYVPQHADDQPKHAKPDDNILA